MRKGLDRGLCVWWLEMGSSELKEVPDGTEVTFEVVE
jgi:hypothetical protein